MIQTQGTRIHSTVKLEHFGNYSRRVRKISYNQLDEGTGNPSVLAFREDMLSPPPFEELFTFLISFPRHHVRVCV